ncbi:MAG: DUF1489 domain-containing protein [Pseudomonadota bacterium]
MRDYESDGPGQLNLLKLCVGAEVVQDLLDWQVRQRAMRLARGDTPEHVHVTRMWPRREAELLGGGSLYWVFKGLILARQRIARLDRVTGDDGIERCAIVLERDVVLTEAAPRRPFQGWRYLPRQDAPADAALSNSREDALPRELTLALAEFGVR